MDETIYWYDFETTGIDPGRDRAIQFAGVRTDLDLNVLGEPLNIFCYPGDDVVPSPDAILVTGIHMTELPQRGLRETDFIAQIAAQFSQPGTCVSGFNSIRFDDEFTRYTLYRNFLDPYAREWQGGNSRWDVIDLFRMAHALRPEGLLWPESAPGVPSFRLEALTEANHVGHANAHDAVADVMATIDVTRKLRHAQGKLYDYLFNLRRKAAVRDQLYPLGKSAIVHVSSMYPAMMNCLAVVLPLCAHPTNPNGVICVDLGADPRDLIDVSPEALYRRIFSTKKALEASGFERIGLKTIHVNRCPAIAPLSTLQGRAETLGIDVKACLSNMRQLQRASGIVEKITDAFSRSHFPAIDDPDLMLYQGDFFSAADRQVMDEVRQAKPADLAQFAARFQDPRLPEMLFRYRARNFPDTLGESERETWDLWRRQQWADNERLQVAQTRTQALQDENGEQACLTDLTRYLASLV
ncbi:MAG: exodeoxyribonuclease-1 [Candidatus Azotimanducaceae bacterium]|jgi:exodeoxyribonuclease-1